MSLEASFLADIRDHPDDDTPRLIYADWLEERGDPRGEFLRLEVRLRSLPEDDPRGESIRHRLRELRDGINEDWLALLDRTPIENCVRFAYACPLRWESLRPTDNETVRFCETCQEEVYHCHSVAQARDWARLGLCVAVDSRLARSPGDIEPPGELITMGILLPEESVEGSDHGEAPADAAGDRDESHQRRGARQRRPKGRRRQTD